MSGSNAGKVPEINLDEFERRLRTAGAPPSGAEDPLAELTRLVTMISRDGVKGDSVAAAPQARMPKAESAPLAASAPQARMPKAESAPLAAGGGLDQPAARPGSGPSQAPVGAATAPSGAVEGFDLSGERRAALSATVEEARPRTRRRSWYFATAGLAAIGLALLAGAATLKIGAPSQQKTPPFIAAAEGPSKIQPPSDAAVRSSADLAALPMKDSATAAPVKVVTTEEQPVDLGAQTPTPAPVAVAAAAGSPVVPAADTPIVAPAAASATVAPLFPDANPVKTVSVRPDGTLISVDSTPTPTPSPPAPSPRGAPRAVDNAPVATAAVPATAAGEAATPKLDLPTKLSPKSSARVVAKTDTTAPAAATDTTPNTPLQIGAPAGATKATKTPPAKAAPVDADAVPTDAAAALGQAAATKATKTSPAKAAASEPAAAGGGWAVQLAAPRSEADAQNAISRLKSKYSAELGDADLVVRKAEVKGETIYRVRAGGLSKDAAAALCVKLKASGGDCFIAKE
jgi:hypothetical protein